MPATLVELASQFECELIGDGETRIERVATLSSAAPDAISFLSNPLYRAQMKSTRAGAVILDRSESAACPVAHLISANPYATYARIAAHLHPPPAVVAGVHPSASIDGTATVSASAEIGPHAVVGPGSLIGDGAAIGAGCFVGADVDIGGATRLAPRCTVLDGTRIGVRCIVHSGAVIGADGFGFALDQGSWVKVPQIGRVVIGNDVEIGANTCIDRAAIEETVIEDGVKLDNLVQIAHNAHIGAHTVMAAMSGVAGSTKVGQRCMFGGRAIAIGHLTICDDVMFTFGSIVTKSVTEPGTYGGSLPAEEQPKWRRNAARFRQLDAMHERLRRLERELTQLSEKKAEQ